MSTPLFAIEGVTKRYGGLTAVQGVSLALQPGELVGLIGPNGAGKTTCFNLITGADTVSEGCVRWQGEDVTALRDWQRARLGMARTFQNIRLWKDMTVRDNVRTVCRAAAQAGWLDGLLRTRRHRRVEAEVSARADALLDRLGVAGLSGLRAGELPYGPQRKLEIARALALEPRLLLLDEPAAGMTPSEKTELMQVVQGLRAQLGLTVLVIEHDMRFVMGICERIVVLDHGELIGQGTPDEVRHDPRVVAAYLGSA